MRPPHWALKAYAAYLHARTERAIANPRATQARLLMRILAAYRHTEMGRSLGLTGIDSPEAFRDQVPVTHDGTYQSWFQRALDHNTPDLVTRGPLQYMARSSGTTNPARS